MEIPIRLAAMMALLVTVTAHPHRRHCHMSRYRSVSPSDIRAASDRLILTLERVTLAVDVLTNMTESPLAKLLSLPLTMLLSLEDDLKICRKSPLYSDPPSEQLMPWLHHLKHFREKVSSECVQDAVLLSLTQLLIEDIMCWANNE
uniref:Interleukin 28B (interferon, lambda 3), gene 1 n=1 Tax=Xenopus tropicalis TaxID=8364 RepID=A0A6I8PVB1_XENTR